MANILDFVLSSYGKAYGISARHRAGLVARFYRTVRAIPAGTTALSHVIMAREILSIPPHVRGDVIECGVWKGASTASLSLVCHVVGRRLLACDSFMGLPDAGLHLYLAPHSRTYGYLKGGMFYGSLAEVQANVKALGRLEVCDFVPGLFAESLKGLTRPIVFAFLDVDLPSSFQDCLQAIWPLLVDNGAIYVDDVGCMKIVRIFFDDMWWEQHLRCPAPGLVGSGCGLPIHSSYSNVGYVRKLPPFQPSQWKRDPDLHYPADYPEGT
ncbi:MAG TPA: TylF/MycF/NovP-related O-methyltransferase [Anaerolineae bacterium]|nr:TylF/MycF/NovP-related O-methyltransferase [Anaerolineae bacterium]